MPFDDFTRGRLEHQGRRMWHALHGQVPPDRTEAKRIQETVDDILDRRPGIHAIAPDGEVIWDNASPFVKDQASGVSVVVNNTGEPEKILTPEQWETLLPDVAPVIEEETS